MNLTVTSSSLQVSFTGADITGITNRLTGETYVRSPSSSMQLNLTLVQPPSQGLAASGAWTVNPGGTSANITFTDSNRTITVAVSVDSVSQQIVVDLDGKASHGGVERLYWGVTGLDLQAGKLVLPAAGGISLTPASFTVASAFTFSTSDPGAHLEAPLSLYQTAQGGVSIYSTDTGSLFKGVTVSGNQLGTVNELFDAEAPGPWNTATEAGPIEWRLAAYQGDWQAGARVYRDWHNTVAPPVALTGARAWVNNIKTVIKFGGAPPYTPSMIDAVSAVIDPTKTLLYLVNWRSSSYDVNYPNYTPDPSIQALVQHAHSLGYHVMLHTDMIGVSPLNSDWTSVQPFQAKDPLSLQLLGWNWNLAASTPLRYGYINPASSTYRALFVNRISGAIQSLQADAIHLDIAGWAVNDGNGLIAGMNYNQGAAQLHRDLLAAFPGLVIGTEGTNDTLSPYGSFVQQIDWNAPWSPDVTPPLPVSHYVLSNVQPYGHLNFADPDTGGFLQLYSQYEGQDVLPTFWVNQGTSDYTQPGWVRYLKVANAFEQNNLTPAWDTAWNGAVVEYSGSNGASAEITDSGTVVQFNVQKPGNPTLLYQRAHQTNQASSPPWVPNWPAYNSNTTLGLDPAYQFWQDGAANDATLPHITGLPSGVKLGLAAGTLVTPQFSYFQLLPASTSLYDFFANLWLANIGITYNGTDFPLQGGAVVYITTMVVGGVSREGIFAHPPFNADVGGETFIEYTAPVPAGSSASLSFAAGILDGAIGQRQGPLTFKVKVNGSVLWQQDVSTGGWQPGSVDLTPYLGQTVKIRFITNPGPSGNPSFAWGGWSLLQMSAGGSSMLGGITMSVPSAVNASRISAAGAIVAVSNGSATINGLAAGGTVYVFNGQPTAISAGQSLFNIPFTISQASTGELAGSPGAAGAGVISSTTSGGVTKPQTLWEFTPPNGQSILSWYLQLPGPHLGLSFSAAYWDGHLPFPQGYLMSVRVSGATLWQKVVGPPASWQPGSIDLSPWAGQPVVLELITDSQGNNTDDFISWAELNFTAIAAPLVISGPASLVTAAAGEAYSPGTTVTANGGSGSYTWSATGLPSGLSIGAVTGTISGTPVSNGGSPFAVQVTVTDSVPNTTTHNYTLTVNPKLAVAAPASLPVATVGAVYHSAAVTATGGVGSYSWSALGLPGGLNIDANTGVIGGTPTSTVGSPFSVQVTATDANSAMASRTFTLAVNTVAACETDGDGIMNVNDVQAIINEVLGASAAIHDFNRDGSITIADVQVVINAALNLGCAAQ